MSEVRREQDKGDLKQSFSNLFSLFKYMLEVVLDRLPNAKILSEEEGVYTVSAEVFGKASICV